MATIRDLLAAKGPRVLWVDPESSVHDAASLMNEHKVGSLLVMRGGHVLGMIAERDILPSGGDHPRPEGVHLWPCLIQGPVERQREKGWLRAEAVSAVGTDKGQGCVVHSIVSIEEGHAVYLTIHLVLFAGAFLLMAWKLCTCPPVDRRLLRSRPLPGSRVVRVSRAGSDYRPVNRISRYLC